MQAGLSAQRAILVLRSAPVPANILRHPAKSPPSFAFSSRPFTCIPLYHHASTSKSPVSPRRRGEGIQITYEHSNCLGSQTRRDREIRRLSTENGLKPNESPKNSTTSIPNTLSSTPSTPPPLPNQTTSSNSTSTETELHQSPYTLPNLITSLRILSCPLLGYLIVNGEMGWAVGLLGVAGWSDWLDGYLARRYKMQSVFGTILDPAADKALMTTLVISLSWGGLLPVPLAVLILGRDVALSISAFYYRYISLPEPKTFKRYWDFSIPSAEVRPTQISKYNTALQLVLMGFTTVSPLLGFDVSLPLQALQWTVAGTTIWSGLSYVGKNNAVKILKQPSRKS